MGLTGKISKIDVDVIFEKLVPDIAGCRCQSLFCENRMLIGLSEFNIIMLISVKDYEKCSCQRIYVLLDEFCSLSSS